LQAKNLVSSQSDSTTLLKVAKNTNETSTSPPSTKEPTMINREQQTTGTPVVPTIDPMLITTIHANKGAIDTIRGQIIELRHDVDHLRKQINNRKRSTTTNTNASTTIPNEASPINLPSVISPPPVVNNIRRVSKSNANNDNANRASFSHHHHHHHHVDQPGTTTGRSSVCIII
jgi:hypothetical protein